MSIDIEKFIDFINTEEFKVTETAKKFHEYLIDDEVTKVKDKFEAEFNELWQINREEVPAVLKCHLILEHFLTKYLKDTNPRLAKNLDDINLSFNQKLKLVRDEGIMTLIWPGVKALNLIRNKIAHNLNYKISDSDLKPLRIFINVLADFSEQKKPTAHLELIQSFTYFICEYFKDGKLTIKRETSLRKILHEIENLMNQKAENE